MSRKKPAALPSPREADIQRDCLSYLSRFTRILAWRTNSGQMTTASTNGRSRVVRFSGAEGCSDALGILPDGRFLAIEFKRPGGKPTEKQRGFLDRVRSQGGLALVVSSLDGLREQLREAGYEVP